MDPASRRYFWNLIRKASEFGITVILTSHSMEECEALCTKLGILSKGQFKTLGTSAYIKSKYGRGFSFSVKCKRRAQADSDRVQLVQDYLLAAIPNTSLKDKQQETLFFQCEGAETPMADIFYQLENNRDSLDIESFAVSETTLEQVFMILEAGQTQKASRHSKQLVDQLTF